MIASKFKIGDRVELLHNYPHGNGYLMCGDTGTVLSDMLGFGGGVKVKWDRYIHGHNCGGECKDGYGWNVREYYLRHEEVFDIDEEKLLQLILE